MMDPAGPSTSLKRPRQASSDDALDEVLAAQADGLKHFISPLNLQQVQPGASAKRTRLTSTWPSPSKPTYAIFHHVICSGIKDHQRHQHEVVYMDAPRLFAKDSKASALRGRVLLEDIDDYLDRNPNTSFLVHRNYSCVDYCHSHRDEFSKLPVPGIDRVALATIRAYFFSLDQNGQDAVAESESIEIVSESLKQAMEGLESQHPDHFGGWLKDTLCSPYRKLFHGRQKLSEFLESAPGMHLVPGQEHVALLFNYVRSQCDEEWDEADELFNSAQVSIHHFDKLFGPNEIVVTMADSSPLAYLCTSVAEAGTGRTLQLTCKSWRYDGSFFKQTVGLTLHWPVDSSLTAINTLRVYPLRYDRSGLKQRLQERGEKFWACRHRNFVGYDAPRSNFDIQVTNPRYMIDTNMYHRLHDVDHTPHDDLTPEIVQNDTPPRGSFCLLLPYEIRGYGMHNKKWSVLNVELIRPIEWNEKAFTQRLVLDSSRKELIQALVTVHINNSENMTTDIIEGKGKGLIILLHGSPGTGKTLTAEAVAELTHRPLYRVTCGDIGTDAEQVEKYLESILSDVFLEERTQMDLQRNALVSVFLRALEHYEGLLILTSNRIGTFDEAFMSRIQLALHYPSLEENGRYRIWTDFIETLQNEVQDVDYEGLRSNRDALAGHNLNGRQIRNAVNTARQLALFQGRRLELSHFEQAIDVAEKFVKYMEETQGHTHAELAKALKLRSK